MRRTEESSAGGAQKWASLYVDAVEFRGHWQRGSTRRRCSCSSRVFSLDDDHAAKLRVCMQRLAADPPPTPTSRASFIQLGAAGRRDRARRLGGAAHRGRKAFVESIHLPLIPEGVWLDALTPEALRLAPPRRRCRRRRRPTGAVVLPDQAGAATVSEAAPAPAAAPAPTDGGARSRRRSRGDARRRPASIACPATCCRRRRLRKGSRRRSSAAPRGSRPRGRPAAAAHPPQLAGRISVAAVAPPALPPVPGLGGLGGIAPPVIASDEGASDARRRPAGMPPPPGARPLPGLRAAARPRRRRRPPGMPPPPLPGPAGARRGPPR